ncbi:hypothetical protein [Nocardia neocaledoniensis]|uniref:hypothetical protein n=1 Tax=Nocardia neocaledoniensis TaxID=236511 RepID=UPI002455AC74|nr:hypothetical protein [Nocardia neocaledoniensis]
MTTDDRPQADTEREEIDLVTAEAPVVGARTDQAGITRRLTSGRAVTAIAVVALAAVGVAAHAAVDNHRVRSREDARAAAQQAACAYAPVLARYDAKDLDTYFAAVLAGATGDWKTEFDATSKDLRAVLTQGQVVSTVGTVRCALESADETSARAVAVINQTITSLGTQGTPTPGQLAVTLSLRKDADRWLVSEVGSPLLAH